MATPLWDSTLCSTAAVFLEEKLLQCLAVVDDTAVAAAAFDCSIDAVAAAAAVAVIGVDAAAVAVLVVVEGVAVHMDG